MTSVQMYDSESLIANSATDPSDTLSRWAARIVVDIGYGIDIGGDSSYVTLVKLVAGYFSLGMEPGRWFVDSFPFRAQFQLKSTS